MSSPRVSALFPQMSAVDPVGKHSCLPNIASCSASTSDPVIKRFNPKVELESVLCRVSSMRHPFCVLLHLVQVKIPKEHKK